MDDMGGRVAFGDHPAAAGAVVPELAGGTGGVVAIITTAAVLHWGHFTLSTEGVSLVFSLEPKIMGIGLIISLVIGLCAGIFPAWRASRMKITESLRMEA